MIAARAAAQSPRGGKFASGLAAAATISVPLPVTA